MSARARSAGWACRPPAAAAHQLQRRQQQDRSQQQQQQQLSPSKVAGGGMKAAVSALFATLQGIITTAQQQAAPGQQPSHPSSSRNTRAAQQQQQQLVSISDCPLLPPGAPLPLRAADGTTVLTLQQLEGREWWRLLPDDLQAAWRREAGGDKWLLCLDAADLRLPEEMPGAAAAAAAGTAGAAGAAGASAKAKGSSSRQQQQQDQDEKQQQLARCALARVLFWARWRLGEPVVVRGLKGRVPWDPETMYRATRNQKAVEERLTLLDCADGSEVGGVKPWTFFRGYSEGLWQLLSTHPPGT